jgi:hypothetical protein
MADPTVPSADLAGDLRQYFALTTATELPRAVRQMSVRTLDARRRGRLHLATGLGALAALALLVVGVTHLGSSAGSGGASLSSGAGPLSAAAPVQPGRPNGSSFGTESVGYPGVDAARLAQSGVMLLPPAGHGTAVLTPAQGLQAAASDLGAAAGTPGPAVLAFVVAPARTTPISCLCWVVDVRISGSPTPDAQGNVTRTELVLVDADSGRIVAALFGNGIP